MASTARKTHMLASYALRGALVGLAVSGTSYLAGQLGVWIADRHREIDGPAAFASIVAPVFLIGLLISPIVGLLVAWVTRLRRPWAVALWGLFAAGLPFCGAGHVQRLLHTHLQTPLLDLVSVLPVFFVLAYATVAVLFAPSTQSWLPRPKRRFSAFRP